MLFPESSLQLHYRYFFQVTAYICISYPLLLPYHLVSPAKPLNIDLQFIV